MTISLEEFEEIIKDDNILNGVRRMMSLAEVIKTYPVLKNAIRQIITDKFDDEDRLRYYPYIASVMMGKEKYTPDDFFMGFGGGADASKFQVWKDEIKNYIIDNEHLHEFWIL